MPHILMHLHGLSNLIPNCVQWIQRHHRFLKDDGNFTTPDMAHFGAAWVELSNINDFAGLFAMQVNLALNDFARWRLD